MNNTQEYCAPVAEYSTLREDGLVCYSGDGVNEDYSLEQFEW